MNQVISTVTNLTICLCVIIGNFILISNNSASESSKIINNTAFWVMIAVSLFVGIIVVMSFGMSVKLR